MRGCRFGLGVVCVGESINCMRTWNACFFALDGCRLDGVHTDLDRDGRERRATLEFCFTEQVGDDYPTAMKLHVTILQK